MAFTSAPSYFTQPSFGVDTSGAFAGTANALTASPFGGTSPTPPTSAGMGPLAIGLGIAGIGASIFGASKQESAARRQSQATEEAARIAAASTEKAARLGAQAQLAGQIGGYGFDYLTSRYEGGAGAAMNRLNGARDMMQTANIQALNPSLNLLRSRERYEQRLANAMPGYQPPSALFA